MSEKEVLQTLLEAANGKITDLTAEVTNLASKLADAQAEVLSMHRRLASESLRADQGWERYENANCDRNSLRAAIAAPVVQVAGGDKHPAWSRMVLYTDTIGGNQTCRDDLWAITSAELRELLAAKVSARAADAPSEPSNPLFTADDLPKVREAKRLMIDVMIASAIPYATIGAFSFQMEKLIKSCAADALDSQPTEPAAEVLARVRDAVAENLRGLYYCSRVWSAWSVGTMGEDDFSPAEEDDDIIANITDAVMSTLAPASSQPTDGEVRNG